MIELVTRPVVGADDESVVVHVEDEILTHHGQPDQGDIGHRLDLLNHLHRPVTYFSLSILRSERKQTPVK